MQMMNRLWLIAACAIALLIPAMTPTGVKAAEDADKAPVVVDMFDAMEEGEIDVKFIPKDSKAATVIITNKTDKPLSVKLPEAFAGVPVLAQIGGGMGGGGMGGGGQGMGGGMGGGGMGGGGGVFNLAPEKAGKIKVTTVCLEHGKPDPNPRMKYEIKPIESFTTKPGVAELCTMLGHGRIDQGSAQAAAWHLNNDMTWQQLAAKNIKHLNGTRELYFARTEIMRGVRIAQTALHLAKQNTPKSPGEQASLAQ